MNKKENKTKFIDLERSLYHEKSVPKNFEFHQEKLIDNLRKQYQQNNVRSK